MVIQACIKDRGLEWGQREWGGADRVMPLLNLVKVPVSLRTLLLVEMQMVSCYSPV